MKLRLSLLFTALLSVAIAQADGFLHVGDTIAIISPSSATDTATINGGRRTLESWDFRVVVGQHALSEYHGFAGTVDERLSDLLWALREPSVRAIMCSRGGDGAVQLLCELPLDTLRRYPKLIIGFSDATALLSAEVRAGHVAIHGSMCHAINTYHGTDTVSLSLRRLLMGEKPAYRVAPHLLNNCGRATGILVGGNLSVLSGLAGSDFDPLLLPSDLILFMEDTGEQMSKIDRLLHLIEVRGLMPRIRSIVVGKFTNYKHPDLGFADMYQMFHEYLRRYAIPVCYDFPVGHSHLNNFPLLVGSPVTLEVSPEATTLTFQ